MKKVSGIYSITCLVNGHQYIGQASNIAIRKNQHFSSLKRHNHFNQHLQRAYDKYGRKNFSFDVLSLCETNKDELTNMEQWWMDNLRPAYNIRPTAESPLGYRCSEETKKKLSLANIGKTHSEESKRKMSERKKGRFVSEESRQRLSLSTKGVPKSEEHRKNMSLGKIGKKLSDTTKNKISMSLLGRVFSEEHKRKISEANRRRGKKHNGEKYFNV